MPQSPNKVVITALVETLQRKVEPAKLYDALRKMNEDLNKTYDTLFFGPLPAVDGAALTATTADNLIGTIPRDVFPGYVAFNDVDNNFQLGQTIVSDDINCYLELGFGDLTSDPKVNPTSYFRLGASADEDFFITQNYSWDGSNFVRDNTSISGSIIQFSDGDINFQWLAPAEPPDYPAEHLVKTWDIHGRDIGHTSFDGTTRLGAIGLNIPDDLVYLGGSAGSMTDLYRGHVVIPQVDNVNLPAIDALAPHRLDGLIVIDKTNHVLCYYANALRYKLNGVAF
jgi:hypothetical protein